MSVSIIGAKRKAINYEFIDLNEDKTVNHGKEKKIGYWRIIWCMRLKLRQFLC